jgi:hypothetical protein
LTDARPILAHITCDDDHSFPLLLSSLHILLLLQVLVLELLNLSSALHTSTSSCSYMPLSYPYTRINAWSDTSSPRSYTSILSDSTIDYNDQLSIQSHECLTASFHTFGVSSEQAHDPTLLSSSFNAARTPNLDESTTSTETVLGHSCRSHLTPSRSFLDMLPSPASQNSILPGDTPRVEDTSSPSIKVTASDSS